MFFVQYGSAGYTKINPDLVLITKCKCLYSWINLSLTESNNLKIIYYGN